MKKTFAVLFLIAFLTVLAAPLVASAQVADCCKIRRTFKFETESFTKDTCYGATADVCPGCTVATVKTSSWGMACILNTIYRVADLAFAILVAFSVLMILLAAYTFMTAAGTPQKVEQARNYVLYAIVGLVVAFLARAIPSIVGMLM